MKNFWKRVINPFLLISSEQGSAMPIIALGVVTLMGASGTAIDMGRLQMVQSRMQNALDAAGLAAGSNINTADMHTMVNQYFYANFPANYMGTTIQSLTISGNADNSILTLNATGKINTTFMKIFGINDMTIAAKSQITRAAKGMELILVMDNTGSMSQSAGSGLTKLQAAQSAAKKLLDILYGSNAKIDDLWVGVVPFSQAVNIGTSRSNWTTTATLNWGTTSWGGCVEARGANNKDITDDPPSVSLFAKYYFPCDTSTNAWYGTNSSRNNCNTGSGLQYKSGLNTTSLGPNLYCPQQLTAMVAEKATIVSAINSMQAVGGTEIPLGLAWGWRMLSPKWRTLWGGQMNTNDLPLNYNTPLMNKVVILMTDGDNDLSYNIYSAYGYPNSGQLGSNACVSSTCTNGETTLNNRTTTICNSMKANGIIIYTVALGTAINTNSKNLLKSCASKAEYAFVSPTSNDLQTAFKTIGDSLANLRISQ